MAEYTFSTLAPNEFEDLTKDLLERWLGISLQAFTTGRDKGIDLRYAPATGENLIVQCKRHTTSFSNLLSAAKKEVPKIHLLRPARYIFVTSLGLTPDNFDELFTLFSPYCTSPHDIIDATALNSILRANPDIEQRHPKLYVTSEAVLRKVLHNDLFVQSALTHQAIQRRVSLYVYTERFSAAVQKLNDDRVCILSGVPGIGKTTLAEMLLLEHIKNDWQLITIRQNVSEAAKIFWENPESKQIFYYDDFLGKVSSGEKLAKNEDAAILQLIDSLQYHQSKRFILTTREYILEQAKREHETLARSTIDVLRFVVACTQYGMETRAQILANHLFFNGVVGAHLAAITDDKGYLQIIQHPNYNPRIIETMTSRLKTQNVRPEDYFDAFINCLDHPEEIWKESFENHLTEASRQLLLCLVACGTPAELDVLEEDFDRFYGSRSQEYGWTRRSTDFHWALQELEGNFVLTQKRANRLVVEWHNPSILDFLLDWLRRHWRDVEALLSVADRFSQIEELTTTVPVLRRESATSEMPIRNEPILAEAMLRTFEPEAASWRELRTALSLSEMYNEGGVRSVTQEMAISVFSQLEHTIVDSSLFIPILNALHRQEWMEEDSLALLREEVKTYCVTFLPRWCDELDHFIPLAKWSVENRSLFSDYEFEEFVLVAGEIVREQARVDPTPNVESFWRDMKAGVEKLGEIFKQEFCDDICRIEENMEKAEKPEPTSQIVNVRTLNSGSSSVDSIFEALVNQPSREME